MCISKLALSRKSNLGKLQKTVYIYLNTVTNFFCEITDNLRVIHYLKSNIKLNRLEKPRFCYATKNYLVNSK